VAESAANKIGRVTPSASFAEFVVPSAATNPAQIATGPDGDLWFSEEVGNRIGRLAP